jgi:hypothetical protein
LWMDPLIRDNELNKIPRIKWGILKEHLVTESNLYEVTTHFNLPLSDLATLFSHWSG